MAGTTKQALPPDADLPVTGERLGVDVHCQILADFMRERVTATYDAFKTYVAMVSTLIGGSVALRLQFPDRAVERYAYAADAVAILMWLVVMIAIVDNYRSWWMLRIRYSEVAGMDDKGARIVPRPRFFGSARVQSMMLVIATATLILFMLFNPLRGAAPDQIQQNLTVPA
ncbi:hypothetical protein P1X14_10480 [Sphingomonas sp. AOB5]|uniref:hypothetical protein n=1 Tax=Sphingomonas sp. AOB5 TaxID=3034017 RepID=UPI0023F64B38|nr:hypothetical protein [Sphingomonas sp. AOB5]MDF7775672.1 hypothetical protein [Sphingomonas sp. AOB5]